MASNDPGLADRILSEIKGLKIDIESSRNELRNIIEACETRILLKFETLKSRITELEKENNQLKDKVELLEISSRKNNIVIYGLDATRNKTISSVCEKINALLHIKLIDADIDGIAILGNSEKSPIKVEFVSFQKRQLVFQNVKKLKQTNVYISPDLTKKQLESRKILRKHLLRIRTNSSSTHCYIKGNKLFINYKPYTIEELECGEIDNEIRPSSAPPTPTVATRYNEENEVFENKAIDTRKATDEVRNKKKVDQVSKAAPILQGTPKEAQNFDTDRRTKQGSYQVSTKPRTRSKNQ